jgi:hypothetical protein
VVRPSRDQVLAALRTFDDERNQGQWPSWEQDASETRAIEHRGNHYPASRILAMASPAANGAVGAENVEQLLAALGFDLVSLAKLRPPAGASGAAGFDLGAAIHRLTGAIARRGFVFEPWQVAAFVTAVRTKPFVILAGVSGTGKSRLPALVAQATGCSATVIPVRPDWTDSSDVLGYVDLQGGFRPGPLLVCADRATHETDRFHLCVIDEMNLARVEHYLAEVLSRIEGRVRLPDGRFESAPLLGLALGDADAKWRDVALPWNLALVGTVNMDESAHGFSRKVLDRAFTLEFSDVDLRVLSEVAASPEAAWPAWAWRADGAPLAQRTGAERDTVAHVIELLVAINAVLAEAQLQVGYRTRDEVALFVLNATAAAASFTTRGGSAVDPLDLALLMKVLPRVAGGSAAVRRVVRGLLGLAVGDALERDGQADDLVRAWRTAGRPAATGKAFPRTAARLCLMWDRLDAEGVTSFWL